MHLAVKGLEREGESRVEESQLVAQLVELKGEDRVVDVYGVAQDEELLVAEKDIILPRILEETLEEVRSRGLNQ